MFLRIILSNTTEIAQEGAVPKKLLTSLHSQESLLGPYEVSQARINVSLILFLPVVPYYLNYCKNWRICANTTDIAQERAVPNEK